jgi:predicted nuclease of predicted toxin-antitoxin system
VGLDRSSDDQVWEYAGLHGFTVVTKDEDYKNLSVLRGTPPRVIWLQIGNCTTSDIEATFRIRIADIKSFEDDLYVGTLVLK